MSRERMRWATAVALLVTIGLAVAWRGRFDPTGLQRWVEAAGAVGPLVFIALYAAATVLFLPGAVITLAGGALFGPVWGTLWNLGGATLGAALAFLIARHLGADWVSRRGGPRLQRLNDGVAGEGWRFIAFVRLVPLLPFNLLNYALGLTRIRFTTYVVASAVFMLPGALAYTWLGHAGRQVLGGDAGLVRNLLIALALAAAMAFLPRWVRKLRARPMLDVDALKQQLDQREDVLIRDLRSAPGFAGPDGPDGHLAGARNPPLEELPARPLSRCALAGLILALVALAVVVAAAIGARAGWWHFLAGLRAAQWAVWGAALALVLSLAGAAQARPKARRRGLLLAVVGIAASAPLFVMGIQWELAARNTPPINDISTDTSDAPVFWDMPNPTDYPGAKVAGLQRAAYPDLAPMKLSLPPALAFEAALAAARSQGWVVVASVPEEGRIEATATSRLYGFVDEVAIRIQAADGGSQVDVRSRSRVGRIDRGVNAKRIRAYLAALGKGVVEPRR